MTQLFRNILFTFMAAIMLGLAGGINVSKMQCSKGSKVFLGVENSNCHLQKSTSCEKIKSTCCKEEARKANRKPPCNKQTIELSYEFDSVISSIYHIGSLKDVNLPTSTLHTHTPITTPQRVQQTIQRDKSPPLVSKPILSQIQSFLI